MDDSSAVGLTALLAECPEADPNGVIPTDIKNFSAFVLAVDASACTTLSVITPVVIGQPGTLSHPCLPDSRDTRSQESGLQLFCGFRRSLRAHVLLSSRPYVALRLDARATMITGTVHAENGTVASNP